MYLALFLFAAGVLLITLEVFIPSFGLLTALALTCFGLSIWQAYDASGATAAWVIACIAPVVALAVLYFGLKYVPRTSWGRGLVLRSPADEDIPTPPTATQTTVNTPAGGTDEPVLRPLIGKQGVAQSDLRPVGVAVIEGRRVDVVSEGARIDAGSRITVVAVEGNRIVVRQVRV